MVAWTPRSWQPRPPQRPRAQPKEPLTLTPFEVTADASDTYQAMNTNSVTDTNTALGKTPLDAKAFNRQRMEPVFMALSHSAALAALAALDQNVSVQDVPYPVLRARLLAAKQILSP